MLYKKVKSCFWFFRQNRNFGNENDPIFLKNIDGQLGNTYIIPNNRVERSNDYAYNVEKIFSRDNIHNINILKHMLYTWNEASLPVAINLLW